MSNRPPEPDLAAAMCFAVLEDHGEGSGEDGAGKRNR